MLRRNIILKIMVISNKCMLNNYFSVGQKLSIPSYDFYAAAAVSLDRSFL